MREGGQEVRRQTARPHRPTALARIRSALKQVVGMPDYAGYVSHARQAHPDRPLLSEREFYDCYLSTRYGNGGSRCC